MVKIQYDRKDKVRKIRAHKTDNADSFGRL